MAKNAMAKKVEAKRKPTHVTAETFHSYLKDCTAESFLPELQLHGMHSPLFLIGSQEIRIKRLLQTIRTKFFAQASVSLVFGAELTSAASVQPITTALSNYSLFSPRQLVVLYDGDLVRAAAADALVQSLGRSTDTSLLCVVFPAKSEKKPLFDRLSAVASRVTFADLQPAQLERWLHREAIQQGAGGISPEAAQLMIKSFGTDLTALTQEIAKVALLVEAGEVIPLSLVKELVLRSPELASFDLLQLLARRSPLAASAFSRRLVTQGLHPLQLSAFLSRAFRTLLAERSAPEAIQHSKELGNAWFRRNLGGAARSYSVEQLQEALEVLARLDISLKDNLVPESFAVERAVERLAML